MEAVMALVICVKGGVLRAKGLRICRPAQSFFGYG